MSLLDKIEKSQVDVSSVVGDIYRVDTSSDVDELVARSPYQLHIIFCESVDVSELVKVCEVAGMRILENIGSIPEIDELGKIQIVWDGLEEKYRLMLGFNPGARSAYAGIWTYCSLLEMLGREEYVVTKEVKLKWVDNGMVMTYLDYVDDILTILDPMNDNRFQKPVLDAIMKVVEVICRRWFSLDEWEDAVRKSGDRYMRIRPWEFKKKSRL